jgi:membrane-associated phospholipid phosphatase
MSFITAIDQSVHSALEVIRIPLIHELFWAISLTAYLAVAAILIYFFVIKPKLYNARSWREIYDHIKHRYAWTLFAGYTVLFFFLSIVKQYAFRVRPNGSDWLSFPSRHAAFAFFIALTFPTENKKAKIALYIWAALVAFSRLILAEHWLSDVVVGAGIGLLFALGFKKIEKTASQ